MYELIYDKRVIKDIENINKKEFIQIGKSIESKLTNKPAVFGKPLRSPLAGLWSLRVGNFRVIYEIVGMKVKILYIAHRKYVYEEIGRRLTRS